MGCFQAFVLEPNFISPTQPWAIKNLIFWPCFGHKGHKSPIKTTILRHPPKKKIAYGAILGGGLRPSTLNPPQIPYINDQRAFSKSPFQPIGGFLKNLMIALKIYYYYW
jgi:hypothetical protein